MTVRRIIVAIYALTTIVAVILTGFFMNEYFGIYTAVRMFDVSVEEFSVVVLNETYALTETLLVVQNPSDYAFEVIYVMQKLLLDGAFFGIRSIDMMADPVWMGSGSEVTIPVQIDVGATGVSRLAESKEKEWDTLIHVGLMVPLVGRSMVRLRERLIPLSSNFEAGFPLCLYQRTGLKTMDSSQGTYL